MGSKLGMDIADSVVFSILLFLALWVSGLIWPASFGAFFGVANSFYFALAYLVAHVVFDIVKDLSYGRSETRTGNPRTTA